MRVHMLDPSAYTPPYDDALCGALGAAGAEVELYTSRFAYSPLAPAHGYVRRDFFYRLSPGAPGSRLRRASKLAQHVPDMLRYRAAARTADVVHFQWLAVQHLDSYLLPAGRPLLITAHDILPREPRPGQRDAQRRLYGRFDAVVVHSEHGRTRLIEEVGVDPARVHVIRHGVLRPWEDVPAGESGDPAAATAPAGARDAPLPPELRGVAGRVVLFFGLLRPYKGLDILLEAWREAGLGAPGEVELWIVGMPRMDMVPLQAAASPGVRFLPRFVYGAEILGVMRRASLIVLPYREIDQSGVAFTALGAGLPLLLSDVGGFPEIAETGAARMVPAGDPLALARALGELLGDPAALAAMSDLARAAVASEYAWEQIAAGTLALYGSLLVNAP